MSDFHLKKVFPLFFHPGIIHLKAAGRLNVPRRLRFDFLLDFFVVLLDVRGHGAEWTNI